MGGWTRDQAISDVMLASDGFGRVYGPDLETPPHLEDFQPCVVELAWRIVKLKARKKYAEVFLREYPKVRCARPGCPQIFLRKSKKRFCSMTCALREARRLRAARLRRKS